MLWSGCWVAQVGAAAVDLLGTLAERLSVDGMGAAVVMRSSRD